MSTLRRSPAVLNVLVIAVTIVFVALALLIGRDTGSENVTALEVGQSAPQDFVAPNLVEVTDEAATEAAKLAARNGVETLFSKDSEATIATRFGLESFFRELEDVAFDTQAGTGGQDPAATVTIPAIEGASRAEASQQLIALGLIVQERAEVSDVVDPGFAIGTDPPAGSDVNPDTVVTVVISTGQEGSGFTLAPTTTVPPVTTTTTLPRRAVEDQLADLRTMFPLVSDSVISDFVALFNSDLDRIAEGEDPVFPQIEAEATALASELLDAGIKQRELADIQAGLVNEPPPVFITGLETDDREVARDAVAELVASQLRANLTIDDAATEIARNEAEAAVPDATRTFLATEVIARQGEILTQVQVDAIDKLGLLQPGATSSRLAVAALGAIVVLLTAFFLWRIAPGQWSEPKHFALLGVLLVLAAATARLPEFVIGDTPEPGYILPAVMFGYIAAILYNPRTAVLLSFPMAVFTAVSTGNIALTVFAAGATVAPIAFVSAVSSRRQLRLAVALAALVLGPMAGTIAWVLGGDGNAWKAAGFAVLGGVIAGLIAQGLLSFLENLFRVTTTLTLLDLTDRNHPALRLLEEKAPGTFNHSIMVGTLAGKAARAIGADPLFAQAASYYHDLGKTENPQYFIENQFGVSNPHDELEPNESASIIRTHVTDGLRLARQYRIPTDVAEAIRQHHGTGLMRYFYHKAMEEDPAVEPGLYRHAGEKPKRKEMAIIMISDAVEGAARALAQHEDPTADSLKKVVDSVVGEKLDDGQLDESDLTFGDLTRVKQAMVAALIGYYHTRIPYPGFPGPQAEGS